MFVGHFIHDLVVCIVDSQVHALLTSGGNDALCPVRSWVWELLFRVPALKSIVNWACCDFLMEISVAWCQRGLSLQLQLRINVINNHQVPF